MITFPYKPVAQMGTQEAGCPGYKNSLFNHGNFSEFLIFLVACNIPSFWHFLASPKNILLRV